MIPKVIHYCWFGGNQLPELAQKCIESWKKYLPDYAIKEWNESNFDVNCCTYVSEAYSAKKWAFVSDYARFKILYEHGGLYFDTDVEIIKSIDDIISKGSFMGIEDEHNYNIAPGLGLAANPGLGLAANPGLGLYKEILDMYDTLHFINSDGSYNMKTVVEYTTALLVQRGLSSNREVQFFGGIYIYPKEYFCPIDYITGECVITENTRTIHHFASSWCCEKDKRKLKIKRFLVKLIGRKNTEKLSNLIKKLKSVS